MYKQPSFWWSLLKNTFHTFSANNASRLGAALSFYTVLSLPPMLMLLITFVGAFFGEQAVKGELDTQLTEIVGAETAAFISGIAENATSTQSGIGLTIVGILAALFSATGVFVQLQDALNTIWKVRPKSGTGNSIWTFLRSRLISILIILNIALLIVAVLIAGAFINFFSAYLASSFSIFAFYIIGTTNFLVSYGLFILIFAAIFKYIPDVSLTWRQVWAGAIFTTLLFGLGRYLIGLYLSHSDATSAYGVTGSLVILLLWIFYSSQILFLGAAFTKSWNQLKGEVIAPRNHAVKIQEVEEQEI